LVRVWVRKSRPEPAFRFQGSGAFFERFQPLTSDSSTTARTGVRAKTILIPKSNEDMKMLKVMSERASGSPRKAVKINLSNPPLPSVKPGSTHRQLSQKETFLLLLKFAGLN
jgi:hypothetical protein